jgi:hypothetical protein
MGRARYYLELLVYYLAMANDLIGALIAAVLSLIGIAALYFFIPDADISLLKKLIVLAFTLITMGVAYWFVKDYIPKPRPKHPMQSERL